MKFTQFEEVKVERSFHLPLSEAFNPSELVKIVLSMSTAKIYREGFISRKFTSVEE
jgi:hypothetical protein